MNAGLADQLLITDVVDPNAKRVRKSGSIPVIDLSFQDFSLFSRHFLRVAVARVAQRLRWHCTGLKCGVLYCIGLKCGVLY